MKPSYHRKHKFRSYYNNIYGITQKEICELLSMGQEKVQELHETGELKTVLRDYKGLTSRTRPFTKHYGAYIPIDKEEKSEDDE